MVDERNQARLQLRDAYETAGRIIKIRYLGIGFVWAWIYCAFETSAVFPNRQGLGINADASWAISAGVVTAALFIFGFAWRNATERQLQIARYAAPALLAAGTLVPLAGAEHTWLQVSSGALTGVGSAWMCLLWAHELSFLDGETLEIAVPLSSIIVVVCALVFPYLHGSVGAIAAASLPVISGVLLFSCTYNRSGTEENPTANRPRQKTASSYFGSLIRPSLVLCVAYLVLGCIAALTPVTSVDAMPYGFDAAAIVGSAFGVAMAFAFIIFTVRIDFSSLFRWLTPLLVLALALFAWQANETAGYISSTIASVADTAMQALAYICAIQLARRRAASPVLCVGVTQGFVQLGVLAGNALGAFSATFIDANQLDITVLVLGIICLLSFAVLLLPRMPDKESANMHTETFDARTNHVVGNAEPIRRADETSSTGDVLDGRFASPIDQTCSALARRYGLSERETEVVGYLARGHSQPYIREELFLSKNTVSTHVKHIYQKLNIHSREELLSLFHK